jgi:adenylylsulfate kinase-like enzyme
MNSWNNTSQNQNELSGRVIWITGLSCTGKSSIASELAIKFSAIGITPVIIDGDQIRNLLPVQLGYTIEDRRQLASFYSKLSRELSQQGHLVICATISLFKTIQEWNRENIPGYFEVWLRAPLEELRKRDQKHLYPDLNSHNNPKIVGLGITAEFPVAADLEIDNHGEMTANASAELIFSTLLNKTHES